ncbi:unnamed protein product [Fasciola hepatica]|uniref:Peptidase M13 N-terminal domain-containing protein n=1 Tax=Fasciola hepatica TaxID=6192 RepID=A0ABC9HFK0_FASHE
MQFRCPSQFVIDHFTQFAWQVGQCKVNADSSLTIAKVDLERLNPKHKEAAIQMFTNIKSALNNKINTSDWMAKEDVVQTMEKVKNVNASIGSPPHMWNITKENETFIYIRELNEKKYFENNLICAESAVLNNLRRLFDNDPHKWSMSPIEAFQVLDKLSPDK